MPQQSTFGGIRKQGDVYVEPGVVREADIVILIMGCTGAGKSTFVNNVLVKGEAPVGHGLKSCTTQVAHYVVDPTPDLAEEFQITGQRIVLVETPGFGCTELSNLEVLRRIAVWLASSYESGMTVGGVIYMHPIHCSRLALHEFCVRVLRKICGEHGLSRVIFVASQWDSCPSAVRDERKRELANTFWSGMLSGSISGHQTEAGIATLESSRDSASGLIRLVLQRRANSRLDGIILTLQRQIVDEGKKVEDTDAGWEIRRQEEKTLGLIPAATDANPPLSTRIMTLFGFT